MNRARPFILLGVAVLIALVTTFLVYNWLSKKAGGKDIAVLKTKPVVVAKVNLPWGKVLSPELVEVKTFLADLSLSDNIEMSKLLTQPLIIPESAEAYKVLSLFKEKHIHFSIVVNEYGTFEGIITLHDILENLIGDIQEEGDITEPDIFIRDDQSFLVSGDAPVEVLDGIIENYMTDFEEIDFSTVAGFVLNHIDKIPQIGDKFTFNGYIIEIVDIDGMRIDKILIRKE